MHVYLCVSTVFFIKKNPLTSRTQFINPIIYSQKLKQECVCSCKGVAITMYFVNPE